MSKITNALALASAVHAGQVDKAGKPYMQHILRVWSTLRNTQHAENVQVVGILHDTIEDDTTNTIDPSFIASMFGWDVANAVNDLTRRNGEEYLTTYISRVKANSVSKLVKMHDLNDHLNRLTGDESFEIPYKTKESMRKRYTAAWEILTHD